ncbi:hypothetical protein L226DRAFT_572571 [Lentinus tigrinus ALCF2SS1-7]|uniref:Uncharacterized protein n=1 Tax=Lentinus tigrinus ALCF2SS1-6 TaxID=1328759 RepID=A0A5C2S318_9APHY|nr:hypothetical protein L227DRAFT_602577 [Lentinus tigrinus ALCF2SS1-6]RPD73129.1 hypothetical protein L226DRAFT_572571 [Lentinus tigrinus ALCF2SS1-7]
MSGSESDGSNTFNLISAAIGMLVAIPVVWAIIQSQLPPAKLRRLEETLTETESLLGSVIEEGLLDPMVSVPHFRSQLSTFRSSADRLREQTYMATTLRKQFAAWFGGLSSRLSVLCEQVAGIRARICETSAEARARLSQQDPSHCEPSGRGWRVVVRGLWRRVAALFYRQSRSSTPHVVEDVQSYPGVDSADFGVDQVAHQDPESPKQDNATLPHTSTPVVSGKTAGPIKTSLRKTFRGQKYEMRALARAIYRVDKELASQVVSHPMLAHIMRAANRRRLSISSKVPRTRRSHKSDSLLFCPSTVPETVVLPQACGSSDGSDADSSEEDTLCDEPISA